MLRLLSDKQEAFTHNDIVRKLSDYVSDPVELKTAIDRLQQSSELIVIEDGTDTNLRFTTRTYQRQHNHMMQVASFLADNKAYGVSQKHSHAAINAQNKALQKQVGANLSTEQCAAIEHVLNRRQFSFHVE